MRRQSKIKFFSLVSLLLGIVTLCGGVFGLYKNYTFLKDKVLTEGNVTHVEVRNEKYFIQVKYSLNGEMISAEEKDSIDPKQKYGKRNLRYYSVPGRTVEIYYNPNNPSEIKIKNMARGYYIGSASALILAAMFLFFSYQFFKGSKILRMN